MKVNSKSPQSLVGHAQANQKQKVKSQDIKNNQVMQKQMANAAKVDLSPKSKEINKAMQIAKETKTDDAKLMRLQQMIDKGTYKPDAAKVADRMVNEHLMFKV